MEDNKIDYEAIIDKSEYNKLCIEFLGYKNPIEDKDFCFYEHSNYNELSVIPKLLEANFENRFLNDWNWIHEVIEKIENTPVCNKGGFAMIINGTLCQWDGTSYIGKTKKEAVIKAIYRFLKWYKERTTKYVSKN